MREPNKNKVYSLDDLTNEELKEISKEVALSTEFLETHKDTALLTFSWKWEMNANIKPKNIVNAKELFYTLENIQVDCRELSKEQIEEMADVFEKAGYKMYNPNNDLIVDNQHYFLSGEDGCFIVFNNQNKTTITYDKFMELFSRKEENFKKLVEVLNEELTEEAYKETEYEVKYIAEKPKQYNIGIDTFNPQPHYNNENGSLYKIANDLGLNHWEFDIFKRLVRCRKKNQFKEDLQKIKDTIDIYLNEFTDEK